MGNAGTGSIWHLAAVTLERETGVKFAHIPFEGGGPAVSALMDGFVDAVPVSPAEVKKYVDEGKLRTLAVNADKRSEAILRRTYTGGRDGDTCQFHRYMEGTCCTEGYAGRYCRAAGRGLYQRDRGQGLP